MRRPLVLLLISVLVLSFSAIAGITQQVHVVRPGENLWSIAQQYGLTLQEVAQANGIAAPYIIHAGNEITIPAPGSAPAQTQPQAQPQTSTTTQAQTWTRTQWDNADDIDNCCHLDRSCHTDEEWTAGWLAFKALECWDEYHAWYNTPDPDYMPVAGSNNCCTAPGWICLNDQHFDAGYRAFATFGHCAPRIKASYLPSRVMLDAIDNCCHFGRQCQTDADWQRGYSDYRYFRCAIHVPLVNNLPVSIQGNQFFVDLWTASFSLLKAQSPRFYDYAISGLNALKEHSHSRGDPQFDGTGCIVICGNEKTAYCKWQHGYEKFVNHESIAVKASVIVHEACHCHREAKGYPDGNSYWTRELPCYKAQADLMKELDPGNSFGIPWEDYRISARQHGVTDLRY